MEIKKLITAQDSDNLSRYFSEIRNFEPLTKEQEKTLIKQIQKGNDQAAMTKLVNANLKFVVSVAKNYQGQGVPLMDLISEGNTGLIEAAKRFDISTDLKFFSYAVWWIRQKMFISLYNGDRQIHLPDNRALLVNAMRKCIADLEQSLQRYPSLEELVTYCKKSRDPKLKKLNEKDISEAIIYGGRAPSLNDVVSTQDEDDTTLQQTLSDDMFDTDEIAKAESIVNDLNRFLYHLTQYEYDVLILSSGLNSQPPLRNQDIGKVLKFKEKDVIKLKNRALKSLRRLKNINSLKDYIS